MLRVFLFSSPNVRRFIPCRIIISEMEKVQAGQLDDKLDHILQGNYYEKEVAMNMDVQGEEQTAEATEEGQMKSGTSTPKLVGHEPGKQKQ